MAHRRGAARLVGQLSANVGPAARVCGCGFVPGWRWAPQPTWYGSPPSTIQYATREAG